MSTIESRLNVSQGEVILGLRVEQLRNSLSFV